MADGTFEVRNSSPFGPTPDPLSSPGGLEPSQIKNEEGVKLDSLGRRRIREPEEERRDLTGPPGTSRGPSRLDIKVEGSGGVRPPDGGPT